jgi:hypothetical protein
MGDYQPADYGAGYRDGFQAALQVLRRDGPVSIAPQIIAAQLEARLSNGRRDTSTGQR